MHYFLPAIGFSDIRNISKQHERIADVVEHHDENRILETEDGRYLAEISREYGPGFGLTVVGEYDDKNIFHPAYMFPYATTKTLSATEDVVIERHVASDSYTGACDDFRIGTTLIFYLQNMGDFMQRKSIHALSYGKKNVHLCAMAMEGTILIPMMEHTLTPAEQIAEKKHNSLLQAAREGDAEAMESLTQEDMDNYSILMERVNSEDVLSIIDTYFMPDGADCECYSILGTILDYRKDRNRATGENIIRMTVECNKVKLDVLINSLDLHGEIAAGRRFKGNIWLQGTVDFG